MVSRASVSRLTDICLMRMLICMRTTLNIDDELMRKVKKHAHDTGRPITRVIEDALRQALTRKPARARRFRLEWQPVSGKLRPGVDLADRDALLELMEGRS